MDLAESLRRAAGGSIPVRVVQLPYGDISFQGNGPDGECPIGMERKRLSDLITSMQDRRLAGHQIRGLTQSYDYRYLIAEGVWRPGPHGEIEELTGKTWGAFYSRESGRPAVAYRQLHNFLTTLELKCDLIVRRTANLAETAAQTIALWHWWNDKAWDEHQSHEALYCGPIPKKGHRSRWGQAHEHNQGFGPGRAGAVGSATDANNPSTLWRAASQLPGIDARAKLVAEHFKTVLNMALAGLEPGLRERVDAWYRENPKAAEKAWREIGGASGVRGGIGEKTAAACVRAVFEEGA